MKQANRAQLDKALDLIYDASQIIGSIASDEMISLVGEDRPLKDSEMSNRLFEEVVLLRQSFNSLWDERRALNMNFHSS